MKVTNNSRKKPLDVRLMSLEVDSISLHTDSPHEVPLGGGIRSPPRGLTRTLEDPTQQAKIPLEVTIIPLTMLNFFGGIDSSSDDLSENRGENSKVFHHLAVCC